MVDEPLPFEDEDPGFTEDEEELLDLALKNLGTFLTEHGHQDPEWAEPDFKDAELSEPEGSPSY